VTVLGAKKELPVVADASILAHPTISVSAGMRGLQMFVEPSAYVRATRAKIAPIARERAT
jgi:Cys-tRNA(Pro)/Cys-tRNA(Cys) deacylase